jgi:hypothetical protein
MKRNLLLLFAVTMSLSMVLISCEKDEKSTPIQLDLSSTATIEGIVKANLNLANDTNELGFFETQLEPAPAGTKIIFKVQSAQYNPQADGNSYTLFETTLNASGGYSIEIPVNNKGVNIQLVPVSFLYDQIQAKVGSKTIPPKRVSYNASTINVNGVITGERRIVDFNYTY